LCYRNLLHQCVRFTVAGAHQHRVRFQGWPDTQN